MFASMVDIQTRILDVLEWKCHLDICPLRFPEGKRWAMKKRKMRRKVKSVFGPCWSLSGSCLMLQQQLSSASHCLFTVFPVNALLYGCCTGASVERSGNPLVFLHCPSTLQAPPTQPIQQEKWRYSHKLGGRHVQYVKKIYVSRV